MRAALDNDRDQCQTLHQVLLTSRLISFISTSKTLNILALNVIFTTFRKQHCVEWVQSQDFKTPFILKKIKSWAEEESWGGWVDVVKNTFKGGIPSGV